MVIICETLNSLHPRMHYMVFVKLAHWFFFRRRILNLVCIFVVLKLFPFNYKKTESFLEKGLTLHLNKLEFPLLKNDLCRVWLKLAKWFCRGRYFIWSVYFYYFLIISPCKRAWPFIWAKVNSVHQRMHCAKLGWNCPYGFEEGF